MKKYRIISLLTVMMLILSLAGCGKTDSGSQSAGNSGSGNVTASSEIEQITYMKCTGDPASYIAYVITSDKITKYNLTDYWMHAPGGYDFFEDGLPDESEYTSYSYKLGPGGWSNIVDAFADNKFVALPEDMKADGICDGPSYDIELKTADGTFRSGGYSAGLGTGKEHERYHEIVVTLNDVISDAVIRAQESGEGLPAPQSYYMPATKEFFENEVDEYCTLDNLTTVLGPCDETNNESALSMLGWELADGGMAWVTFGEAERVRDIILSYDDHFVVVRSGLGGIPADPDEKYTYMDLDDLTGDEIVLYELISDMICNEAEAISEDHLHSLDDYIVVCTYGEEIDLDEPAFLGEDAPFSHYRMTSSALAAFYSEVLGDEREFEPVSDPDYRPEIGIICGNDGFCYTYNACGWADYSKVVSVAKSSSLIIVNTEVINGMSEETGAYERFVLKRTGSVYGFELTDYEFIYVS